MVTDSLVGTWDLVNYDMKPVGGGEVVHPLGSNAIGRLTYAADGSMSAFIAAADRPAIGWRGESIEAEAAAYESFNAYAGTYSIDGGRVVHQLEQHIDNEAHVRGEQHRRVMRRGLDLFLLLVRVPGGGHHDGDLTLHAQGQQHVGPLGRAEVDHHVDARIDPQPRRHAHAAFPQARRLANIPTLSRVFGTLQGGADGQLRVFQGQLDDAHSHAAARAVQLQTGEEALGFYRRALEEEPTHLGALTRTASAAFVLGEDGSALREEARDIARRVLGLVKAIEDD